MINTKRFLACMLISLSGCMSNFHEHHYFRSVDTRGRPINYYRVDVDGGVFLSTSRYLSGYFDETAVDTYFNEFSQPPNGQLITNPSSSGAQTSGVAPLDSKLQNRKLVLLLSSNSDEIATGISALAQSDDVTNTLSAIVSRDHQQQATKTLLNQKTASAEGNALRSLGDATVGTLTNSSKSLDVQTQFLTFANGLASFFQPGKTFTTLADAKLWVEQNAAHLQEKQP